MAIINKTININMNSKVILQQKTKGKTFSRVNLHYANGVKVQITAYTNGSTSFKANKPFNYDNRTDTYTIII